MEYEYWTKDHAWITAILLAITGGLLVSSTLHEWFGFLPKMETPFFLLLILLVVVTVVAGHFSWHEKQDKKESEVKKHEE